MNRQTPVKNIWSTRILNWLGKINTNGIKNWSYYKIGVYLSAFFFLAPIAWMCIVESRLLLGGAPTLPVDLLSGGSLIMFAIGPMLNPFLTSIFVRRLRNRDPKAINLAAFSIALSFFTAHLFSPYLASTPFSIKPFENTSSPGPPRGTKEYAMKSTTFS